MLGINIQNIENMDTRENTNEQYLVSVIIATYRRNIGLESALISIIQQTYEFVEVIVVDDNADEKWNEKVKNIVAQITRKYNRIIIYKKNDSNKGSAETRNIGIEIASGDYITFLDDDDIYLQNKIKNQLAHMLKENSDFSLTDLFLYDESDNLIEKRNRRYIKKNNKEHLLMYHFMYHMTGTDTMMFKKKYLKKIGGFPLIDVGDEFYLMQKAIEYDGRFSYLPECDVKAYVHIETMGLSSGDGKIEGENDLYKHKKKYNCLPKHSKRYIKMRHYAVLAFAELRRKRYAFCIKYTVKSFLSSPINCLLLFIRRKYKME